jgi:hypothetical protein
MSRCAVRFLPVVVALLGAVPAWAEMVVEVDEAADFSTFASYRWVEGLPAQRGGVEKQIHASVEGQMQARGLRRVEDGPADIDVSTWVLTDTNVDLWSATATTTWGRVGTIQVRDTIDGTLVVRLTRSGTNDMLWHAMVHEIVDPGLTSEQLERKVDRLIDKMFRKYPKPSGKK